MSIKTKNEPVVFDESEDPDAIPAHIAKRLSPEELKDVKEIAKLCRLSRERDPEIAAMLDAAIERACEDENM